MCESKGVLLNFLKILAHVCSYSKRFPVTRSKQEKKVGCSVKYNLPNKIFVADFTHIKSFLEIEIGACSLSTRVLCFPSMLADFSCSQKSLPPVRCSVLTQLEGKLTIFILPKFLFMIKRNSIINELQVLFA